MSKSIVSLAALSVVATGLADAQEMVPQRAVTYYLDADMHKDALNLDGQLNETYRDVLSEEICIQSGYIACEYNDAVKAESPYAINLIVTGNTPNAKKEARMMMNTGVTGASLTKGHWGQDVQMVSNPAYKLGQ